MDTKQTPIQDGFERFAATSSRAAGSFWAFLLAFMTIVVWAASGPIFGFSETWQLVINTSTTIVTFLMVFLIQHAQNKEMRAVQFKLNELIAAVEGASNRLIDVEALSDHELANLYARFQRLTKEAAQLSHGVKMTIDDAGAESAPGDSRELTEGTGDAGDPPKRPVPIKPEAQNRKR